MELIQELLIVVFFLIYFEISIFVIYWSRYRFPFFTLLLNDLVRYTFSCFFLLLFSLSFVFFSSKLPFETIARISVILSPCLTFLTLFIQYCFRQKQSSPSFIFNRLNAMQAQEMKQEILVYLHHVSDKIQVSSKSSCFDESWVHFSLGDRNFLYISTQDKNQNQQTLTLNFTTFPEWAFLDVKKMMTVITRKYNQQFPYGALALEYFMVGIVVIAFSYADHFFFHNNFFYFLLFIFVINLIIRLCQAIWKRTHKSEETPEYNKNKDKGTVL